MNTDPLALLFSPTLNMDVDTFYHLWWSAIKVSASASKRVRVKDVDCRKKVVEPGHEYLFIVVRDILISQNMSFVLERTVDLDAATRKSPAQAANIVEAFVNHPDCKIVLDAILNALTSTPSAILVAGAAAAAPPLFLSVPVVASVVLPLSVASTLLLSPSCVGSSLPFTNPIKVPSRNSAVDSASLAVVAAFHRLSELSSICSTSKAAQKIKPEKDSPADDRWLVGTKADTREYAYADGKRLIFHPLYLTLYHMAILAFVVHRLYPTYSLFKRNCYWFTALIYYAAKIIDGMLKSREEKSHHEAKPHHEDPEDPKGMTDEFFLPSDPSDPSPAGHWMHFKVCEVKPVVLNQVVTLFFKKLEELEFEVLHSF